MTTHSNNTAKTSKVRSVSIAMLTFRRTDELRQAVESVLINAVPGPDASWQLHEILIIDNNPDGLAEPIVAALQAANSGNGGHNAQIRYVHEGSGGIVAGRNRALDEAQGNTLVFIDDDEVALAGWPHGLLDVMARTGADMVGGPVLSEFVEQPADWVIESGLFARDDHPDGTELSWLRTGNLAMDLDRVRGAALRFDPRFPHGEDVTFSMQAVDRGLSLRWSSSAAVTEYVPLDRTTIKWRCNRQRISTNAWVRAELDLDRSLRRKLLVVGRSIYRAVQAIFFIVAGAVTRREATRNTGLALLSQTRGAFEGLATHIRALGLR